MPAAPTSANRLGHRVLALLSFGVAAYAIVAYAFFPLGAAVHVSLRESFAAQPAAVYAHVFGSAVALLVGPWQFSARLRARRPALHRMLGKVYLGVGVGIGGLAGLALAASASGGLVARLGFAALALGWLYTAVHALGAAQQRDFAAHRRWMMRNFALTLAAVTLRLWLPGALAAGVPFERAYPAVAWLCWLPNLVLAEWLLRRAAPAPRAA